MRPPGLSTNPIRGGYAFDRNTLVGNPGFGVPGTTTQFGRVNGKADAAFDRRMGNSVQYWSPTWAGVSFRLDWEVNEGKGPAVAGGPTINPNIFAADVQYDIGTLSLRYAYERHNDEVRRAVPTERLIDWRPGDGWQPICSILGLPVPDEPFPHENTAAEFETRRRAWQSRAGAGS